MKLKAKVWFAGDDGDAVFGRGRAELLEAVDATGSISAAARQVGMSYRHAWAMIRASEQRMGRRLLVRSRGGTGGGGARLTDGARALVRAFRAVEADFAKLTEEKQRALRNVLD